MIVKSLLAGVVLAGMAGGGVYYGLSPIEGENVVEQRVKSIPPKIVTVKKVAEAKAHPHSDRKEASKKKEETAKKSWIDQYVNIEAKGDTKKTVEPKTSGMVKTEAGNSKKIQDAELEAQKMKAKAPAEKELTHMKKMQREAKGTFVVKTDKPPSAIGTMESFDTIGIIMREAEEIGSTDLRDRAYLNVVDYALMHGYFGKAKAALAKISQPEIRETARSRIAVKYAGTGNPEAAFDLVDNVEMTDFKDAMRIQIIEALIAAESLPDGGQ